MSYPARAEGLVNMINPTFPYESEVIFSAKFHGFEFRIFLLLDRLPYKSETAKSTKFISSWREKRPNLPNLSVAGGRTVGFITFPRVLALCEMQLASHPGVELVSPCPFPTMLTITARNWYTHTHTHTHQTSGNTPPPQRVSCYNLKQSVDEALVMLEL